MFLLVPARRVANVGLSREFFYGAGCAYYDKAMTASQQTGAKRKARAVCIGRYPVIEFIMS
ncbi:hypothetical protein D3C71_1966410 [compost metagenome]